MLPKKSSSPIVIKAVDSKISQKEEAATNASPSLITESGPQISSLIARYDSAASTKPQAINANHLSATKREGNLVEVMPPLASPQKPEVSISKPPIPQRTGVVGSPKKETLLSHPVTRQNSNENNTAEKPVEIFKEVVKKTTKVEKGSIGEMDEISIATMIKNLKNGIATLTKRSTLSEKNDNASLSSDDRGSIRDYNKTTEEVVNKLNNLVDAEFSQDKEEELDRKKQKNLDQREQIQEEKRHLALEYSKQFFTALFQRQEDVAQKIAVNEYFDPNIANEHGELPLNVAIATKQIGVAVLLISHNKFNPKQRCKNGATALHILLDQKVTDIDEMMLTLLLKKINPSLCNSNNKTARDLFLIKNPNAEQDSQCIEIIKNLQKSNQQTTATETKLSSSPTNVSPAKPPVPRRPNKQNSFGQTMALIEDANLKATTNTLYELDGFTSLLDQKKQSILTAKGITEDFKQSIVTYEQETRNITVQLKDLIAEQKNVEEESRSNEKQLAHLNVEVTNLNLEYSRKFTRAVSDRNWSEVNRIISCHYFDPNLEDKNCELPLNVMMQQAVIAAEVLAATKKADPVNAKDVAKAEEEAVKAKNTVKAMLALKTLKANVPQSRDNKTALFIMLDRRPAKYIDIDVELLQLALEKINPLHLDNSKPPKTAKMLYLAYHFNGQDPRAQKISAMLTEKEETLRDLYKNSKILIPERLKTINKEIRQKLENAAQANAPVAANLETTTKSHSQTSDMEKHKKIEMLRKLNTMQFDNHQTPENYNEKFHRDLLRIVEKSVEEFTSSLNQTLLLKDEISEIEKELKKETDVITKKLSTLHDEHNDEKISLKLINDCFPDVYVKVYQASGIDTRKRTESITKKLAGAVKEAAAAVVAKTATKDSSNNVIKPNVQTSSPTGLKK